VIESLLDQKVMVKDSGWFYYDVTLSGVKGQEASHSAIAAIVNEKDRARAYVPIDTITDSKVFEDAANILRGEYPQLANVPTRDIKTKYARRIERAYALRLMGAKQDEVEAALKGQ